MPREGVGQDEEGEQGMAGEQTLEAPLGGRLDGSGGGHGEASLCRAGLDSAAVCNYVPSVTAAKAASYRTFAVAVTSTFR
jgi:hypothetical protein